jgi:hypothetical protein
MKARDLFRNRTIRAVAVVYGVFMVILLATSLTSGDGLPGAPAVLYFFASW